MVIHRAQTLSSYLQAKKSGTLKIITFKCYMKAFKIVQNFYQNALNSVSGVQKMKIFPGKQAPRPPFCHFFLLVGGGGGSHIKS